MAQKNGNVLQNSFKTFENISTQWKMFWKMTAIILGAIILIQAFVMYYTYKKRPDVYLRGVSKKDICLLQTYVHTEIQKVIKIDGKDFDVEVNCGIPSTVSYSSFCKIYKPRVVNYVIPQLKMNILRVYFTLCPLYILYFLLIYGFSRHHKKTIEDKFVRGKERVDEEDMNELLTNFDNSYKFKLNTKISIPESIVTRHNFAIGKPGSGKSQLIFKMVEQIIERDVKCIIHDFKGDFIPSFYNSKKHYIFNPLDKRHMGLDDDEGKIKGWTIFNELHTYPDVESIATSLIPENKNSDPIWHTAPRDLLKAMLIYCIQNDKMTNAILYDNMLENPDTVKKMMATFPEGKIALKHLEDPKLSGQFNAIIATYLAPLQYLKGSDGNFSIEKWVEEPNPEKKVIFLANQAKVQDTLKTLITTFFDFSTKALCSMPDDHNRRIYFILDEFGQLSKMGSLVQLLTQSRSKGGAAFILIQDMAQIQHIYGQDLSRSIVNSCGNKFYFSVGDESTAEFISKEIGSHELERTKESKSFGVENLGDNISIQEETVERRIALPSEIMSQKSLSFYMSLTDLPLTQVQIDYKKYPFLSKGYIPRDMIVKRNGDPVPNSTENPENSSVSTESSNTIYIEKENKEKEEYAKSVLGYAQLRSSSPEDELEKPDEDLFASLPAEYGFKAQDANTNSDNTNEETEKEQSISDNF